MNNGYTNYYHILGVKNDVHIDDIRRQFRHLAQKYHPDKNNNSQESHLHFKAILEAYETLSSEKSRKTYDEYLRTSTIIPAADKAPKPNAATETTDNVITQLNYILWEVEDLYTKTAQEILKQRYNCYSLEEWLSVILAFLDKWVLCPAGFGDYFFTARQIDQKKPYDPLTRDFTAPHLPYTDYLDYFYQIRRRTDKFMHSCTDSTLTGKSGGYSITIIDALFETIRLSYHYLVSVRQVLSGDADTISIYKHFNDIFTEETKSYIGSPVSPDSQ